MHHHFDRLPVCPCHGQREIGIAEQRSNRRRMPVKQDSAGMTAEHGRISPREHGAHTVNQLCGQRRRLCRRGGGHNGDEGTASQTPGDGFCRQAGLDFFGDRQNQFITSRKAFQPVEIDEMINHQHDQHPAIHFTVMFKLVGIGQQEAAAVGQPGQGIGQCFQPEFFGALAFGCKNMLQAGRQDIHGFDHGMQQRGNIPAG